ncbi:MAG TPA: DUF2914 domain-containing protein [Candidatus Sulfotelmatobacter sp.]|nr:DUF2914 domain-containing protein [Candidatus Sulfotelmatobacter sp.]
MVKIAGYVKQREPKWPYIIIVALIALLFFGGLFSVSLLREWWHGLMVRRPSPTEIKLPPAAPVVTPEAAKPVVQPASPAAASSSGITVEKITLTSAITEDNQPADDLAEVAVKETPTVYCYTRVSSKDLPEKISHVWIAPGGKTIAEIKLDVSSRPSVSWSYISLYGASAGNWEVQVRSADGNILAKKDFTTN